MRSSWLLAVIASAIAIGCSQDHEAEKVAANAQAIQGGTIDTTHKYAVGVCIGSGCNGICSGALIAPNVVATARHCVDNTPQQIDCSVDPPFGARKTSTVRVTTHHDMFNAPAASFRNVARIVVPTDNHICGNDLALLVLQTSIPASEAAPVIPGVQYPMNDSRYLAQFAAIGYGNTGPSGGGSGIRRLRTAIPILCIPGDKKRPCPAGFNQREFIAGDGTCSGDSGSGAFEQNSYVNGTPVNFGVLSRGGVSDDGQTCQGSVYTRLDQFRDLVIDTVRTASNNWALYPEPSWTTYVPPKVDPPAPDAGPSPRGNKQIGEECAVNEDCAEGTCVDPGTGVFVCTKPCGAAALGACPEGFTCQEGLCFVPPEGGGSSGKITRTTEGCAVPAENHDASWGYVAVLGAAVGLSAARRRRK